MHFASIISESTRSHARRSLAWRSLYRCAVLLACILAGCGTTKTYTATEQLLLSDAVDATVAKLDFSVLTSRKVYLDSTYLKTVKTPVLIDSDYVLSSLRQQMMGYGVLLVEARDEADIIAEPRIGALGMNGHDVIYGIPASNTLASASAAIGGSPVLPALPEISFARREGRQGAAKLAVFAYDRVSREPLWQSGVARSTSTSKDIWLLGIGPFQKGTIHEGYRFAGTPVTGEEEVGESDTIRQSRTFEDYLRPRIYPRLASEVPEVISAAGQREGALSTEPATNSPPAEQ